MLVLFLVIGIQLAVSQIVSHKKRLHSAVAEYAGAVLCNARYFPVSKQRPEIFTAMKSLAVDLLQYPGLVGSTILEATVVLLMQKSWF